MCFIAAIGSGVPVQRIKSKVEVICDTTGLFQYVHNRSFYSVSFD